MIRSGILGLILLGLAGCGQSASAAAPVPEKTAEEPARLEGMAYDDARKVILGYGWKPWAGPCAQGKESCARYPEIDACSISAPVRCAMRFSRGKRCLIVGTAGEAAPGYQRGEPTVESVTFRNGTCAW